jgi:hypothetical protein
MVVFHTRQFVSRECLARAPSYLRSTLQITETLAVAILLILLDSCEKQTAKAHEWDHEWTRIGTRMDTKKTLTADGRGFTQIKDEDALESFSDRPSPRKLEIAGDDREAASA